MQIHLLFFFWLCHRYKIQDEKGRMELLRKLVAAKRLKYHRDGESLLKGKKVLKIIQKQGDSNA